MGERHRSLKKTGVGHPSLEDRVSRSVHPWIIAGWVARGNTGQEACQSLHAAAIFQ